MITIEDFLKLIIRRFWFTFIFPLLNLKLEHEIYKNVVYLILWFLIFFNKCRQVYEVNQLFIIISGWKKFSLLFNYSIRNQAKINISIYIIHL